MKAVGNWPIFRHGIAMQRCPIFTAGLSNISHASFVFRPPAEAPLHSVLVPTADTVRLKYLLSALISTGSHALLVGEIGAGKTMVIASMLEALAGSHAGLTINLSARTSSNALQDTIEGRLEKRTKVSLTAEHHLFAVLSQIIGGQLWLAA